MTAREKLSDYVAKLPVEDDDELFTECLKVLAEGAVERIAISDPTALLDLICSQAKPQKSDSGPSSNPPWKDTPAAS